MMAEPGTPLPYGVIGFCPFCGQEISVVAVSLTGIAIWSKCLRMKCKGSHRKIETDEQGFQIGKFRGKPKYILSRPLFESRIESRWR